MPYTPSEVREKVNGAEKLSEKQTRQFAHVFNSCWEKNQDEGKCHAMAWGAVKKSGSAEGRMLTEAELERAADEKVAAELVAIARELAEIDGARTAGLLDDLRASKISTAITSLFGRIINLKNDITEALTTLQHESDDEEVKEILKGIPVLKDVLQLGRELRALASKMPRKDEVQLRIVKVLTV